MTKLELVKNELDKLNVFDNKLNSIASDMAKILGDDIPFPMSLAIANYTMSSFVGHFHYKINVSEGNLVPPNVIIFILAKSGAKKTSSMTKLEKSVQRGIDEINRFRMVQEKERAEEAGANPRKLNPLANALATEAGMIKRLNDFKREGIGLPAMYVDEISTELATNPDIVPNIKLVSQLFDIGEMKSKPLKDSENQSDEVNGMGMTALFIGSEHGLLEEESVLKKFETEFISKLSRRCYFVYPAFAREDDSLDETKDHDKLMDELLSQIEESSADSHDIAERVNEVAYKVAVDALEKDIRIIEVSSEAKRLYQVYKMYCEELSNNIDDEALNLEQQHRHWKAFKLAGTYAVFNGRNVIQIEDLKEAINCAELTANDLEKFIYKAKRETYEIILDHFVEGGNELTIHEMIKKGWIKKQPDLKNLLINANSKLGKVGMVEEKDDVVSFSKYDSNNGIGCSFKVINNEEIQKLVKAGADKELISRAKAKVAHSAVDGFTFKITTFEKLSNLLCNDFAYLPFELKSSEDGAIYNNVVTPNPKGGIRGKDNIVGGAEFIVLDIDDSDITDTEVHDLLMDYKHVIARTSDPSNPYKFRVILTLDIIVTLPGTRWKVFMAKVSEHLCIKIDLLPQSQVYYGYKNRNVLINAEGEDLEASILIKQLGEPTKEVIRLPRRKLNAVWENRRNEFAYAYRGREGGRSLHNGLFNAMRHAHDLGFNYQENCDLLEDIIDFVEDKPRDNFLPSLESQRKQVYGMD